MGRSLRLKVIAEGVEVEHESAFLKAQNCDEAQGFFFGRPMTAEEFARARQHAGELIWLRFTQTEQMVSSPYCSGISDGTTGAYAIHIEDD